MVLSAAQLLRNLEPAVRPTALVAPSTQPSAPFEAQSFDQLLALASKGKIDSGRPVEASFDVQPPLDSGQLERLSKAADQAEASGAKYSHAGRAATQARDRQYIGTSGLQGIAAWGNVCSSG